MKSTISRSCAAKADTWCAPVATGAKKIPPGEKKTFYICAGVMHESCNEWKLMEIEVIHLLTLVKCIKLMPNLSRSVGLNGPHAKNRIYIIISSVQGGAAKHKIYCTSISEGRVSSRKNREIWNFWCSWNFSELPHLTLGGFRLSPREASPPNIIRRSFSWHPSTDGVFSTPIPHWGQIQ